MPHDNHTTSSINCDAQLHPLKKWLSLTTSWRDPFPPPKLEKHNNILVVREDLLGLKKGGTGFGVGGKARGAALLFKTLRQAGYDTVAYVAPRFGFAGISCAYIGRMYSMKVHLFMPACEQISEHQMVAIELGAIPHFVKIASMPVLNGYAKKWAEKHNAYFVPMGLKHELVTAALIRTAYNLKINAGQFWTAMSTGVLNRALQIAWPEATAYGVAVARNIKEGERGRATIISSPFEFSKNSKFDAGFDSASNYDLKAAEELDAMNPKWNVDRPVVFWNVAGNIKPKDPNLWQHINSQRAWGDHQDLT